LSTILIVGGAGFIGSQTAKLVAAAGHKPVVFDNLSSGHRWALRWGVFEEGDLADREAIDSVLTRHHVDAVIDFAAHIEVGESVRNPRKYFRNNLVNTLNLLDAMVDKGVRQIVFSSTAAVYGDPLTVPIPEDHRLLPVNPYGESKLFVERTLRWYGEAYGLRWAALRYFNAAGADPAGGIGEMREVETHLIPRAMMALQGYVPDFAVFGDDYDTPDGTAIRDYIHVTDLAAAHVLALKLLLGGHSGGAFNLGTGNGLSVREILAAIAAETGREVPHVVKPRRAGDPTYLVADPSAARATLNFHPVHSDLATIIRTAWAWHKKAHPLKTGEPVRG
jgi:UDP-glucose 4-epimerase